MRGVEPSARRVAAGKALAAAAVMLMPPRFAWALFGVGDIVFDPVNYVQTLTTAVNSVKQTWAQYEQVRQQLLQIDQLARQLKAIDPAAAAHVIAQVPEARDLRALDSATTATADLPGSIGTVRRHFGQGVFELPFGKVYAPMVDAGVFLLFTWAACWWMYRRKLFVRI